MGAEIERVHVFTFKRYLNVASQTPNTKVYGETGCYPLYVTPAIKSCEILAASGNDISRKTHKEGIQYVSKHGQHR